MEFKSNLQPDVSKTSDRNFNSILLLVLLIIFFTSVNTTLIFASDNVWYSSLLELNICIMYYTAHNTSPCNFKDW